MVGFQSPLSKKDMPLHPFIPVGPLGCVIKPTALEFFHKDEVHASNHEGCPDCGLDILATTG